MTQFCQFCKQPIASPGPDGRPNVVRPFVTYAAKVYCATPCWDKVQLIAARTGGTL